MATAWTRAQVVAAGGYQKESKMSKDVVIRSQIMNFDSIASLASGSLAHSDTFQCLDVKAGETILMAGINVLTAASGAAVADLGFTGGTVDHFIDGLVMNDTSLPSNTTCLDAPMYIASADTIDLLESGASASLAGCKAIVWALIARI